jgi:hypothetical protein
MCSLPNSGEAGEPKELFTDDPAPGERFIEGEDKRPGRGVYQCSTNWLGARRRSLRQWRSCGLFISDLDLQKHRSSRDEVITRPRPARRIYLGARQRPGNLHVGIEIKMRRHATRRVRVRWQVETSSRKLAADPAPVHPAA